MSVEEVIYRTLGDDAVFFSNPTPTLALPGKTARCGYAEAAWDDATCTMLEPRLWIQCGQVAGLGPEGDYLCEKHMAGWYCENCDSPLAEYYPYSWCGHCAEAPLEPPTEDALFAAMDECADTLLEDRDGQGYDEDSDYSNEDDTPN